MQFNFNMFIRRHVNSDVFLGSSNNTEVETRDPEANPPSEEQNF